MKTINFVLSGLGGQGILFLTRVLAQCALDKGIPVLGAETHGMAQRGGSVVSHLRTGDVESSLVREGTAHFLLALEENEAYRNLAVLSEKGTLCVNASGNPFPKDSVRPYLEKMKIQSRALPVGKIALELNAPLAANSGLLGVFAALENTPFAKADIRATIARLSPKRFQDLNLKVFDACLEKTSAT
ncbi:MAG: indolepyruvate oxidoreductase subunit beta [Deltaproteobacteria bacterium]|nr:indolepyruvate oxidoreductase subunit beta [Deltaproteobacteria bacterium]MBW1954313.1 indolepyruvate oxidoreductase subunit beta [Deltaproteobacteria bacterium]MBW2040840.1 indolepyruvate oxidoreductase subunit beta [Deltaproteobacteria bacterium]MBW2132396.1 indolepyruvate oxidoreductase subunit beta [Deltaproteobacteria bacterium]